MTDEARTISSNMKGAAETPGSGGSAAEPADVWATWGRSGEELPRNIGAGLDAVLSKQSKVALWAEALLLVAGFTALDYMLGVEINLSVFYLIPVIFATWFISRRTGLFIAVLSVALWTAFDRLGGLGFSSPLITWDGLVHLTFFIVVLQLVHIMKESRIREAELARTDSLTGVANGRNFSDRARLELASMRRNHHPLTMAYIDLDRFKHINDTLGHTEGDRVLRTVATAIRSRLRETDIVARLGGDEFGVLFPDTGRDAAPAVLASVKDAVADSVDGSWDIGCTIGGVTFEMAPESVDFMVRSADELMYRGKRAGRDRVEHAVWPGLSVGHDRVETPPTC